MYNRIDGPGIVEPTEGVGTAGIGKGGEGEMEGRV